MSVFDLISILEDYLAVLGLDFLYFVSESDGGILLISLDLNFALAYAEQRGLVLLTA